MKLINEEKAQTSMELLMLLGGAIAIATVVGLYLKSMATGIGGEYTPPE